MARSNGIAIRQELRKLFPSTKLMQLARFTGAVIRQRKVKIEAFFWTLVLGFGVGRKRTIAGLRRVYEKTTGTSIEESSFYDRFTPALVRMLKYATAHAFEHSIGVGRRLRGHLQAFLDVILTDSTVVRLHDLLAKAFPACRTNHTQAALKAHAILSVTGGGKQSVKVTSQRQHDGPVFRVGRWVTDRLLIFDLGYFRYQLFSCITRNGGYFLSRLKGNTNPTIVALNRSHRGRSIALEGQKLRDVIGRLKRCVLDVEVVVRFPRRRYGGRRHYTTQTLRVVAVLDERTKRYHVYVTNVPPEKLAAEDIQATYALRWEIELVFAELKDNYRLKDMPSRKRVVVEALLYVTLLTLVVSRRLLMVIRNRLAKQADRTKQRRWAAVFESTTLDLVAIVCRPYKEVRSLERRVGLTLLREAVDPNRSRPSLLQAIEAGVHEYR
jgi:putative transposase